MKTFFQDRLQRRNRYGSGGMAFYARRVYLPLKYTRYTRNSMLLLKMKKRNENLTQIISLNTKKKPGVAP